MSTVLTIARDRGSVEYLAYEFDTFTLADGTPATPPTTYQLSAVPRGTYPVDADWHDAPWLPTGLTVGVVYDLRIRFTDTPEVPVRRVARLVLS